MALDRPPRGALSVGRFLQLVIGAIACNNVVPGRPGDFLRAHWLGRAAGSSRTRALGTVVVDRAADVLVLVAALGSSLLFVGHEDSWLTRIDLAASVVGATLLLGLFGARFYVRRRPDGVAASRVGRLVGGVLAGVAQGGKPARRTRGGCAQCSGLGRVGGRCLVDRRGGRHPAFATRGDLRDGRREPRCGDPIVAGFRRHLSVALCRISGASRGRRRTRIRVLGDAPRGVVRADDDRRRCSACSQWGASCVSA